MKKFLSLLIILTVFCVNCFAHEGEHEHEHEDTQETGALLQASFKPPEGWRYADDKELSPSIKVMVIGKGGYEYPPSINLGTEEFKGTLKDYLKIVKTLNQNLGKEWKDLGKIRTEAGIASLSQSDIKTEWGDVRMMHVILVKSGMAYIMTAASRKEEFPKFYKEFFASMRSLKIEKPSE